MKITDFAKDLIVSKVIEYAKKSKALDDATDNLCLKKEELHSLISIINADFCLNSPKITHDYAKSRIISCRDDVTSACKLHIDCSDDELIAKKILFDALKNYINLDRD